MAASTTDALFVTANVGSIFEDPTSMLKIWCEEFLGALSHHNPKFIALHCQEVGGKNYEESMQHVSDFVKLLMSSEELQLFDKVRIYLDEDYSSAEHFTALGNFYFIHESIPDENVQIFNFQENKFEPAQGKEVFSENIEDVATKEKSKFPQEFFPQCKWSRKGFMRTRWNLNGTVFDLVNIHLFHDDSNFVAMESFPSVYCKNRQRALEHTLKRFHTDQYGTVPFFVFGDFNFRTDTQGVVKRLSEGLNAVKIPSSKSTDHAKLQYCDESSQQVVFTLGKKEFSHQDHQKLFIGDESKWLRDFDREFESFSGQLFEFNINFPPTYPYVEDSETGRGEMYMQTRCPSWCDRVCLSSSAQELVDTTGEDSTPKYGLIGLNACMGDHKPVFLRAALIGGLGTVSCCTLPAAPCTSCLSAASPLEHICRLCSEQSVEHSALPLFCEPEQDHSGLVVPKFHRHTSPYTPDSTDTEPDLGEELSPSEEPMFLKTKHDRRLNRFDLTPRKRPIASSETTQHPEENLSRGSSTRKSGSKIPVRIQDTKESVSSPHTSSTSKIPVLKHTILKLDRDSISKCRNGRHASLPVSTSDDLGNRFVLKNDDYSISPDLQSSDVLVSDVSSIPKLCSLETRKHLCRQMNIDEHSSDSDSTSVELRDDQFSLLEQGANDGMSDESKVEIQFSLVETPPALLSPTDCESDGFLTAKAHGLGGSTTDSGVSVSPDLSVAMSPTADEPDQVIPEQTPNLESPEGDSHKPETNPLSQERFSFVRRIQSASAMERKSSFPLPSTVFIENQSVLTGFGGSGSDLWGMRTCRCMSDGSWRQRSSTISHSLLSSKTDSRIRLISTSSHLDRSLPRLQSHHSSSDEDWFEEVGNEPQRGRKADHEQAVNSGDAKVKRNVVECTKRLSTHQEHAREKNSDSNISSENDNDNVGMRALTSNPESVLKTHSQSQFQSESRRAIAAVGKTLANTCFVDTERSIKSSGLNATNLPEMMKIELSFNEGKQEVEEEADSVVKAEEVPLQLRVQEGTLSHVESTGKAEESLIQTRRTSVTSNNSKAPNAKSCKACCTLL